MSGSRSAFTLVEILIVVLILGILAAIIVPSFSSATSEAARTTTFDELQKLRRHIEVFRARNSNALPAVAAGAGTWGEIVGPEYLMAAPTNSWVGGANATTIVIGSAADTAYQNGYGWIYDPATGAVWAGGFDSADSPLPRN